MHVGCLFLLETKYFTERATKENRTIYLGYMRYKQALLLIQPLFTIQEIQI